MSTTKETTYSKLSFDQKDRIKQRAIEYDKEQIEKGLIRQIRFNLKKEYADKLDVITSNLKTKGVTSSRAETLRYLIDFFIEKEGLNDQK